MNTKTKQKNKFTTELSMLKWNDILNYESVGTIVYLAMQSGEIIKGYRKEPTQTRSDVDIYYRLYDDTPIDKNSIVAWAHT